ncbi:LytTR family DNA-binding domain-containing protein [Cyclobacterium sp. 1_MG-2023]|uniref:LytR/AlgR family response regulator transcription factor n=1 Tax=Cyclobacterium sp. 1_MG-2023 TaxID=3062681 RepID=UPI0026E3534B|nr:LytTR family DNA-binding domain-containing protein [Cyclobacterium sp. 1_MG-2023]MDO6439977.1 LytTR family DNA-binding domain-containing protein [Cyclobacterium sp. 1_MG-2023]
MSTSQPTKNALKTVSLKFNHSSLWSWFQKLIILIIFSLVVNHLSNPESFPDGKSYRFPVEGFLSTIALCILIGIIAELNFKHYKKKYFSKKVENTSISRYMVSTLGYITIMYIPLGIVLNKIASGEAEFYYLLIGLLITLLLSIILIGLAYSLDIYNLYKLSIKDNEITIESGGKITKLTYENIVCFYSENKIVYTVQNNGTSITTDFTLNELEEKINDQLFFRVNRKIIIHKDAVDQIEKVENGKLRITLKTSFENDAISEINISRYKRKEFMNWFQ